MDNDMIKFIKRLETIQGQGLTSEQVLFTAYENLVRVLQQLTRKGYSDITLLLALDNNNNYIDRLSQVIANDDKVGEGPLEYLNYLKRIRPEFESHLPRLVLFNLQNPNDVNDGHGALSEFTGVMAKHSGFKVFQSYYQEFFTKLNVRVETAYDMWLQAKYLYKRSKSAEELGNKLNLPTGFVGHIKGGLLTYVVVGSRVIVEQDGRVLLNKAPSTIIKRDIDLIKQYLPQQ